LYSYFFILASFHHVANYCLYGFRITAFGVTFFQITLNH
jgi:hypothetical protein